MDKNDGRQIKEKANLLKLVFSSYLKQTTDRPMKVISKFRSYNLKTVITSSFKIRAQKG